MSTVRTNAILDASGGNTATINSMTPTADSLQGFRNRIINGDMGIDQRNTGASVTLTSGGIYTVDRWIGFENTDGAMTAQQSTAAPTGFINSLLFTTTTADGSLSSTQFSCLQQYIEGLNLTDLGWGTANAKTITISFWVRSSLTGTFGGALRNAAGDRTYPFTYTISAANTWEYETITIAGDTTGTWLTTNAIGVQVTFGLGVGTDLSGTAGSWSGNNNLSATGAVNVMGTLNATWQITGVQFEVGSVATPFERIDYGRELIMCFRYFQMIARDNNSILPGQLVAQSSGVACPPTGNISLLTAMRTIPTVFQTGTEYRFNGNTTSANVGGTWNVTGSPFVAANYQTINIEYSATVTVGSITTARIITNGGYFGVSAEL